MDIVQTILTIIVFICGLMISICLHELGHMLPAKFFKIPVSQYMIGLGPTLWSKTIGETEYGIKAIWLGGYTRILGMLPPKREDKKDWGPFKKVISEARVESMAELPEDKIGSAFYNQTMPKKLLCMSGGILTNLVLGFLFFTIAFGLIGGKGPSTIVDTVSECNSTSNICVASRMGLQQNDKIIKINDIAVNSFDEISQMISDRPNKPIALTVERDGKSMQLVILNAGVSANTDGKNVGKLGFTPLMQEKHLGLLDLFSLTGTAIKGTFNGILSIPQQTFFSLKSIFTHEVRGSGSILSLVGVGQITVQQVSMSTTIWQKIASILSIMGSLNVALFVLNVIPLLPFDGGHILNALYEGTKRGIYKLRKKSRPAPADIAATIPVAYFGWGFLLLCTLILVLTDIINPVQL